ncbi:tetratricopeptide repeat protein [bacterium]|nr:tetratricopeptide repeat protein [bacterium]
MNRIKELILLTLILIFLTVVPLKAELVNPGFEETYIVPETEGFYKVLQDDDWKFDKPLVLPKGWRPNRGIKMPNRQHRLITDSKQSHSGNNCIYLIGHFAQDGTLGVTAGDEIEISLYVKDPNKKTAGVNLYYYSIGEKNKRLFAGSGAFNIKTEEEWTKQTGTIKIPNESRGMRVNFVKLAIYSKTGAYFDDISLIHKRPTSWLNFQDAWIEGNKKFEEKNFSGARQDYLTGLKLTEERQERLDTLLKIAETYQNEEKFTQEIEVLNRIIEAENPDIETKLSVIFKISEGYVKLKEYDKARGQLNNILKMGKEANPVKVEAQQEISDTWIKEKNYPKAILSLEEIFKMEQAGNLVKVSTQFKLGDTYLLAKDNRKAEESYLKVLSMRGLTFVDKLDANIKVGNIYRSEKNYEKTREFYHKALSVEDVNRWSRSSLFNNIADTYLAENNYDKAREYLQKITNGTLEFIGWNTVKPAFIKIGNTYSKEGNYEKERQMYDEMFDWVEKNYPKVNRSTSEIILAYAERCKLFGDSFWKTGDKVKAEEYYLLFLETGKGKLDTKMLKDVEKKIGINRPAEHIRKGDSLFSEDEYVKAKKEFLKVFELETATPRQKSITYIKIGDIYMIEDQYNNARKEYQKAYDVKGVGVEEKISALFLIGDSYAVEQNYKQAKEQYNKILSIKEAVASHKIKAQEKIAEMFRGELNYTKAKEEYTKLLSMEGVTSRQKQEFTQRIRTIYR